MNNRQAGRRRGRNNQRPNGGGNRGNGGDSGNRIDNRARGNAAQLLEKYKNMARDAQMAGDRVNAEYYLQFADHYFRVLADNRARQEEQQSRYRRPEEGGADDYDGDEFDGGADDMGDDMPAYAQPQPQRDERRDRPQPHQPREDRGWQSRDDRQGREDRQSRDDRPFRDDRQPRGEDRQPRGEDRQPRGEDRQPRGNGYSQDDRPQREDRPYREDRRPRYEDREFRQPRGAQRSDAAPVTGEAAAAPVAEAVAATPAPRPRGRPRKVRPEEAAEQAGLDLAALPPAISRADGPAEGDAGEETKPRRGRRPRPAAEAAE
jgi:hypothetical protein